MSISPNIAIIGLSLQLKRMQIQAKRVLGPIPWVRCASGNVFSFLQHLLFVYLYLCLFDIWSIWYLVCLYLHTYICVIVFSHLPPLWCLDFVCKKEMGPIVTWLTSFLLSFMWEPPDGKGVPPARLTTKDCSEIYYIHLIKCK